MLFANIVLIISIALSSFVRDWIIKHIGIRFSIGYLEFENFWNNNQFILENDKVFNIVPQDSVTSIEGLFISEGVGKVSIGNTVKINLEDFPSQEFGYLEGNVSSIANSKLVRDGENFTLIKIALNSNGTSLSKIVDIQQGMEGTLGIIAESKKISSRIFERLKF